MQMNHKNINRLNKDQKKVNQLKKDQKKVNLNKNNRMKNQNKKKYHLKLKMNHLKKKIQNITMTTQYSKIFFISFKNNYQYLKDFIMVILIKKINAFI